MRMVKTPAWPADRFKALIDRVLDGTGLNKAQLASLVGMNPSQLSRWTNGSGRPRFDSLIGLGKALQARYPDLGVGPSQLAAAAGYSTEADEEVPQPSWGAVTPSPAAEAKAPAAETPAPEIKDPTPTEAALLAYVEAMRQELTNVNAMVEAQSEKIDELLERRKRKSA